MYYNREMKQRNEEGENRIGGKDKRKMKRGCENKARGGPWQPLMRGRERMEKSNCYIIPTFFLPFFLFFTHGGGVIKFTLTPIT